MKLNSGMSSVTFRRDIRRIKTPKLEKTFFFESEVF